MNSNSVLYVFEWDKNIIKYCKEFNDKVFKYSNVNIIGRDDNEFYEKFSAYLKRSNGVIVHRPSLEVIQKSNEILYNLINDYYLVKQSLGNDEILELEEENFKVNIKGNYKRIEELIEKHRDAKKTYIVVAAGPSLDQELDLLKENRDKFKIISVGSALRALMNKEIRPDVIVIIDGKEIVKKQFEGYENENIPLC